MRSGMKRHQRRDQLPKAGRTDKLRAVERMKPGSAHRRRVADIVQPRRRHQTVRCLRIEMPTEALGCRRDPPHMRQPPRLPSQPRLGLPPCTLRQNPAHTRQPTSPIAAAQTPQLMLGAVVTAQPAGTRRLPAGFATLPLLPSAGAPVRAGRYASPSVRRHTSLSTTNQRPHPKGVSTPASRQARAVLAPRRRTERRGRQAR